MPDSHEFYIFYVKDRWLSVEIELVENIDILWCYHMSFAWTFEFRLNLVNLFSFLLLCVDFFNDFWFLRFFSWLMVISMTFLLWFVWVFKGVGNIDPFDDALLICIGWFSVCVFIHFIHVFYFLDFLHFLLKLFLFWLHLSYFPFQLQNILTPAAI